MLVMTSPDVSVVGGGVVGLSIAWRCAQRGLRVAVVDPAPGHGAAHTAAGMLAPVTELHYEARAPASAAGRARAAHGVPLGGARAPRPKPGVGPPISGVRGRAGGRERPRRR